MQKQQLELQPLETHETDWAPDSVDVTLNVQLDAAFVPSMTEGTRLDMAHLVVLDNFITDEHRQQLLDAITAPAWQGCDPPQPKWERATCDGAGLPATWGLSVGDVLGSVRVQGVQGWGLKWCICSSKAAVCDVWWRYGLGVSKALETKL